MRRQARSRYRNHRTQPNRRRHSIDTGTILLLVLCVISTVGLLYTGLDLFHVFDPAVETTTVLELPTTTEATTEAPTEPPTPEERLEAIWANDPRVPVEARGIYITGPVAGTVNTLGALIDLVDRTELNAVVIDVKNDNGEITYEMNEETVQAIGAVTRYVADMPGLVQRLKEKNIYVIARVVAFKDPVLAEQMPEYSLKTTDGGTFRDKDGLAWVNPFHKGVWEYLVNVSKQAIAIGFDEIQFDYIRFSTDRGMADVDFGPEAEGLKKTDAITGFVKYACEELVPLGAFVSADVYGTIINNPSDGKIVGQDYQEMARYLDYICPMIYPSHYNDGVYGIDHPDMDPYTLILRSMQDSEALLAEVAEEGHVAKSRAWLQDFTATWLANHITYGPDQIRAQINGVYDSGSPQEWILWNGSNRYTEGGLLPQE